MKKKDQTAWTYITHDLKNAALLPEQRDALLSHALQQVITSTSALGTALIWPCEERKVPWKIYYAGSKRDAMHPWLTARLQISIDAMVSLLQQDSPACPLETSPLLILPLNVSPSAPARSGLWIIWAAQFLPAPLSESLPEHIESARRMLEAILEVEEKEDQYFSQRSPLSDRALIEELAHGNDRALSAFLSLTRVMVNADFTFWAQAYQDVVEITGHLGARHSGFGFTLMRGQGVGGRVAAQGTIVIGDYRYSPYRDVSVCDIVDNELIRSGIALPVRYNTAHDSRAHVAAVLYATRRTVSHFSMAECLLIQRLTRLLEPLPFVTRPQAFFSPGIQNLPDHKVEWYDIALHSNRIEDVEVWISRFIKGRAVVVDEEGAPYVFSHSECLEQMKAEQAEALQIISLTAPGVHQPGQIYLHPTISLPPPQWPNFFADLVMTCNLVLSRMERSQDQLDRQREQWLHSLLQGKSPRHIESDGYRLGLPIERGQLLVLAWPLETMQALKVARKRLTAENVVLDMVKSPLIFFEDDMAVVLLEKHAPLPLSKLRNALLKHCNVHPFWIIHGGHYRSFLDLRMALTRAISLAQKARREKHGEYLLDTYMFGLDSLLENPGLADELNTFASRLLAPLIEYDSINGSHFTETLVLAHTLGSAQAVADQLAVHANTIRYRLHRAEDILGRDLNSPKEQTAMILAAFIWQHFHPVEREILQKLVEDDDGQRKSRIRSV